MDDRPQMEWKRMILNQRDYNFYFDGLPRRCLRNCRVSVTNAIVYGRIKTPDRSLSREELFEFCLHQTFIDLCPGVHFPLIKLGAKCHGVTECVGDVTFRTKSSGVGVREITSNFLIQHCLGIKRKELL